MNRMRLIAAVVVGVLAAIGVFGFWQRSEASDPRLGGAVIVKPTQTPSTPASTTRPAGSSRADKSADGNGSQAPAVGKAARPVAPAPAPAAGSDDTDSDTDSDSDNDSDSDSDD